MQQHPSNDSNPSVTSSSDLPSPANTTKPQRKPQNPDDALQKEIAAEIEHGQLTEDELNSGNDI